MNTLKVILVSLACLLFLIVSPCSAANVLYEISGELTGSFYPVADDPFADLLNVPRASQNTIPFNLQLVIDTNNTPYVEHDTSILQQVTYREAIVSSVLNLNGTEFVTLRKPLQHSSEVPPPNMNIPNDEGNIEILNYVDAGMDNFTINIGQYLPDATSLFNDFTVPINQTINGTFYDSAIVDLNRFSIRVSGSGLLDGIEIPSENGFVDPVPLGTGISVLLTADWGEFVPESLELGGITGLTGGVSNFSITPVPIPGAIWLLSTGLIGIVGLRRKHRS